MLSSTGAAIAALLPHVSPARALRCADIAARRLADTVLILENLSDGRNLSACLRTADALGLAHVVLVERWGCAGEAPVAGVDKGAAKWLSLRRFATAGDAAAYVRGELRADIYATALVPGALPLAAAVRASLAGGAAASGGAAPRPRVALAFGSEHRGISAALRAHATACFYVPQAGFVESMNVSVAAAVALSAFCRRTPDYEEALVAGRGAGLVRETAAAAAAALAAAEEEEGAAPVAVGAARRRVDAGALLRRIEAGRLAPPPPAGGGLYVERLGAAEQEALLLTMLITAVTNAEKILERKGVRPPDL